MTTTTITVDSNLLCAVRVHAAKKDVRVFLNGIHFAGKRLIASDGNSLAIAQLGCEVAEPVTVPATALKHIKPGKGDVRIEIDGKILTISQSGVSVQSVSLGGKYIDISRAIAPARVPSGKPAAYSAKMLKKLVATHTALQRCDVGSETIIHYNGHDVAYVDVQEPRLAVFIMPLRIDAASSVFPPWALDANY